MNIHDLMFNAVLPPIAHVHAVYQLKPHPTDFPSLISAVSGNNEVSIWDMETATRRQMLWASPAPPFGEMTDKVLTATTVANVFM